MRILYVADVRSPIARNWMRYFVERGHEIHLVSIYPGASGLELASLTTIHLPFSRLTASGDSSGSRNSTPGKTRRASLGSTALRSLVSPWLRTTLRHWVIPSALPAAAVQLKEVIERIEPDLIHAMRIPYEGFLAAAASPRQPLLVSIWGNDFTLHAGSTARMSRLTRQTLQRASGLHADCQRDLRLAREWGFALENPAVVLPGNGGVRTEIFHTVQGEESALNNHETRPTVINPRGMRAYVRNDTFFRAIPLVLAKRPDVYFVCPAMAGEAQAEAWTRRSGIGAAVELLPKVPHEQMAELFRQSQVALSITTHDGTPNTLLEALACGCFPIAGELESLLEWIEPGVNGFLVDPSDYEALAGAILLALDQPHLRQKARDINSRLISERADYRRVMKQAEEFYCSLL